MTSLRGVCTSARGCRWRGCLPAGSVSSLRASLLPRPALPPLCLLQSQEEGPSLPKACHFRKKAWWEARGPGSLTPLGAPGPCVWGANLLAGLTSPRELSHSLSRSSNALQAVHWGRRAALQSADLSAWNVLSQHPLVPSPAHSQLTVTCPDRSSELISQGDPPCAAHPRVIPGASLQRSLPRAARSSF